MQVPACRVLGRPHADGVLRDGVEVPQQLTIVRVIGAHESADPIFAAGGPDQDLTLDRGRNHRLAVANFGISDLPLPNDRAGFGVKRDQLGVERRDKYLVLIDGDAAIVRAAAESRHRSELWLIVPDLGTGFGVERVDMAE